MTRPGGTPDELQRLTAVSRSLTDSDSVEEVLDTTVACAVDLLDATCAVLLLKDEEDGLLRVHAGRGLDPDTTEGFGEALDERLVKRLEEMLGARAGRGLLGVPLVVRSAVAGILAVARDDPGDPQTDRRGEWLLAALADQAAIALVRKSSEQTSTRVHGKDALQMVGHDLRSPLNALKGYVHLLQEGRFGEVSDAQETVLERLDGITDHITALARNIQDFAQLAQDTLAVETQPVRLSEVVEEARAMVELRARAQDLEVTVSVPRSLEVMAEPDRLRQVMIHLLDNAIKHAPEDSRIEVSAQTAGGRVAVLVADEGPGVPPESAEIIFEAYQQLPDGRESAGLGLGLAIGRALVEHMGGSLDLVEDDRPGATFRIELAEAR